MTMRKRKTLKKMKTKLVKGRHPRKKRRAKRKRKIRRRIKIPPKNLAKKNMVEQVQFVSSFYFTLFQFDFTNLKGLRVIVMIALVRN